MNSLDAVYKVLSEAGQPLHYKKITDRILALNIWETEGNTPEATINGQLSVDLKRSGDRSRFLRTAPGTYGLREWGLQEFINKTTTKAEPSKLETQKLSFTDAAEFVLEQVADKKPMHYRDITDQILELDLVNTEGKTPEATLYALILTEIRRKTKRGDTPRFVQYREGLVGLRKWMGEGLAYRIEQHNHDIKKKLLKQLYEITPLAFEQLIGRLLGEMGFEEIEVTSHGGDGGIDVRAILVVGDVIRTRMAIQAKRWKGHNVQSPIIQQVRGSLGAHEQGMIITTSGFSKGAIDEAARADAVPVALVNGEQLVDLLIEHQVLIKRVPYELIYLENES
jgi:restriction system protein